MLLQCTAVNRMQNGAAPCCFVSNSCVAVHKLLSWLPYCTTPSVAQTSCGVSLISLLYTSTQRAERIMTRRELKIIATQPLPALSDGIWDWIHLVVETKTEKRQTEVENKSELSLSQVLNPSLAYSGWGQLSESKHRKEGKRLDISWKDEK